MSAYRMSLLTFSAKALQVPCHFSTQWQVSGIEPLNLLDTGPGILGKVEDVHLSLTEDDSHTDGGVPQGLDGVILIGERVMLDVCHRQGMIEPTGNVFGGNSSVQSVRHENVIGGFGIWISLLDPLIDADRHWHRISNPKSGLAVTNGQYQAARVVGNLNVSMSYSIQFGSGRSHERVCHKED